MCVACRQDTSDQGRCTWDMKAFAAAHQHQKRMQHASRQDAEEEGRGGVGEQVSGDELASKTRKGTPSVLLSICGYRADRGAGAGYVAADTQRASRAAEGRHNTTQEASMPQGNGK